MNETLGSGYSALLLAGKTTKTVCMNNGGERWWPHLFKIAKKLYYLTLALVKLCTLHLHFSQWDHEKSTYLIVMNLVGSGCSDPEEPIKF